MVECAQDKFVHIYGLLRDSGRSSALAMEMLQSCTEPSMCDMLMYLHVHIYTCICLFVYVLCAIVWTFFYVYNYWEGLTYILVYA